MSDRKFTQYKITFERIGRTHTVEPLTVKAFDADDLAQKVHKYARKYLLSRDYDVDLDIDTATGDGAGFISCGMHSGGEFSVEVVR